MNPKNKIQKMIEESRISTDTRTEDKILGDALEHLDKLKSQKSPSSGADIWRIIMKNPIIKLAAAAVIIIAVLVISMPFTKSGVAWGALVEKIQKVESVVYNITADVKMQNVPQQQMSSQKGISYYSSDYGTKSETYLNDKLSMIMYLNPKENLYLTLIPESKTFMRVTNKSQDELKQISDKDDPRVMVRQMMLDEYKELGHNTINGIDVEGIECSGPGILGGMFEDGTARLWVEIGTDLPVRIEIDGIVSGGQMEMNMVMEDFQWNVDLDPNIFVPVIPEDYKSQDMTIPESNEGSAINGLKIFAELTDGHYPQSLVYMSLVKELSELLTKKYGIEIISKQEEYTSTLTDMLPAGTFYTQLKAADKEVVYYGNTVTADDSGEVLLRWKVSNDVYRVVFADLSAGNFSAEELAELEK